MKFLNFFLLLWVIFALLDPNSGSGSTDPIESGSNSDPDPQPNHCLYSALILTFLFSRMWRLLVHPRPLLSPHSWWSMTGSGPTPTLTSSPMISRTAISPPPRPPRRRRTCGWRSTRRRERSRGTSPGSRTVACVARSGSSAPSAAISMIAMIRSAGPPTR